jgi:hypothetical protein
MNPECSAMRVRRLDAGEFAGAERERIAQHVAGCARCTATQRELEAERELLQGEAPFPQFAAGVAEKLAQRPRRNWAPLAIAAGALLAVSSALVLRPADTERVRGKGGPTAQLFVQDASGVHELSGAVAEGARLRVSLHPSGRKHATVSLLEQGDTSVIYDGPATEGPMPQAFEWTGRGVATLRIAFDQDVVEIPLRR